MAQDAAKIAERVKEELFAVQFINGADDKYNTFKEHLHNENLTGRKAYLKTLVDAFYTLQNFAGVNTRPTPSACVSFV